MSRATTSGAARDAATATDAWPMDQPLWFWGPGDPFTIQHSYQGVQVLGGVGSGKSSGSGRTILDALMRHGYGGLVLCAKVSDLQDYLEIAREAGREGSVIVFEPGGPHRFNWLAYEWARPGPGARSVLGIVQLFATLIELADRGNGQASGGGGDPYWGRSMLQLIRYATQLTALADGALDLATIYKVIATAPQSYEQAQDGAWQADSDFFQLMARGQARLGAMELHEVEDFEYASRYFYRFFAQLAPETRGPIVQGAINLIDGYLTHPLRELFATTTNIVPEMAVNHGSIIIVNLPIKEYGEAGRLGSAIMKLSYQRSAERRDVSRHPRPTFLFCDEAHLYLSQTDQLFQTTARSQRACTVYLFQNIDTLIASMGGSWTVRHLANSMLGNLATTVFHANSSAETNEWASARIGSTLRWLTGGSTSNANSLYGPGQASGNVSESFLAQVFPMEFQLLRSGGEEHDRWVDAIVTQQGRAFANGLNHARCSFRQKERPSR